MHQCTNWHMRMHMKIAKAKSYISKEGEWNAEETIGRLFYIALEN